MIDKTPDDSPGAPGENRTVTDFDCPGVRLKVPPPLSTEKGATRLPTLPAKVPVEPERFVIVTV